MLNDEKHTMPAAEFEEKFGEQFKALTAQIPMMPSVHSLALENERLRAALGTAAISLDCLKGLDTRNEYHVLTARQAIRAVMGA